jgi:hypothetical protein
VLSTKVLAGIRNVVVVLDPEFNRDRTVARLAEAVEFVGVRDIMEKIILCKGLFPVF